MEECKHEFIGHDGYVECIKCGARLTAEEYRELKNKVKVPPIEKGTQKKNTKKENKKEIKK